VYLKYSRKNILNYTRTEGVIDVFLPRHWSYGDFYVRLLEAFDVSVVRTEGSDGYCYRRFVPPYWNATGYRYQTISSTFGTLVLHNGTWYLVLAGTASTAQYWCFSCTAVWRPFHGAFCTVSSSDFYWSLSHSTVSIFCPCSARI
jgi:hypothetical protein